jgi:hypothetical protein
MPEFVAKMELPRDIEWVYLRECRALCGVIWRGRTSWFSPSAEGGVGLVSPRHGPRPDEELLCFQPQLAALPGGAPHHLPPGCPPERRRTRPSGRPSPMSGSGQGRHLPLRRVASGGFFPHLLFSRPPAAARWPLSATLHHSQEVLGLKSKVSAAPTYPAILFPASFMTAVLFISSFQFGITLVSADRESP